MAIPIKQGGAGMEGMAERPVRPAGIESEKTPEKESRVERREAERAEKTSAESQPAAPPVVAPAVTVMPEASRDPLLLEVEQKLEEGLWDTYRQMPQSARAKFKAEGERVAAALRNAIAAGRVVANKVLSLIERWLRMIPGVNRWFLMQEAKIKTDAIIELARERGGENN